MNDQQSGPVSASGPVPVPSEGFPTAATDDAVSTTACDKQVRRLRAQLTPTQRLLTGIQAGHGALAVEMWSGRAAVGWTLWGYTLELENGRPLGSLLYQESQDSRVVRVGVRWTHADEQLEAVALHASEPRAADSATASEIRELERDARGRVGALMAALAEVGSFVSTAETEDQLLAAAGLDRSRDRADQ